MEPCRASLGLHRVEVPDDEQDGSGRQRERDRRPDGEAKNEAGRPAAAGSLRGGLDVEARHYFPPIGIAPLTGPTTGAVTSSTVFFVSSTTGRVTSRTVPVAPSTAPGGGGGGGPGGGAGGGDTSPAGRRSGRARAGWGAGRLGP